MPFSTLPQAAAPGEIVLEAYPINLPEPLVTAILDDPEMEREGRTTAILVYGFKYQHQASGAEIVVPENFVTDFASIPRAARMVISPFGRHAKAAVLHDWLYAIGEPGRKWFADRVFYDAMTELRVEDGRRDVMYESVHLFGKGGYERAAADWGKSWGEWRKGEFTPPTSRREDHFVANWPKPPKPGYKG